MIERIRVVTDLEVDPISCVDIAFKPPIKSPFLPTWVAIPDEMARHFLVTDIKIGKNSQLVSTGCLPASLFDESMSKRINLEDIGLSIEHLVPNSTRDTFRISVTNASNNSQTITIDIYGRYIGDRPHNIEFKYALGLGSTLITHNGSANIHVQPQRNFIPSHLFVPSHVLDGIVVDELYTDHLGEKMPTRRSYVMPATLLEDRLRQNGHITLSPQSIVETSQFVTLAVTNHSPSKQYFTGAILGSIPSE